MTNVPVGFGTPLSVVVLAIVFGIIAFGRNIPLLPQEMGFGEGEIAKQVTQIIG